MKVLVTGASGFIGGAVCRTLAASGMDVLGAVRREAALPSGVTAFRVNDINGNTDWRQAVTGMDVVLHLAGRAHVMHDHAADPLEMFRAINRDGTAALADQAAAAGVKRFVFVSSIKVNGDFAPVDHPFRPENVPAPTDPYGISKAEAEDALTFVAARYGMEIVVVRPPLVHGPGVKGNLAILTKALRRGLPLPLGSVNNNHRSLVGVDNLTDLLRVCLTHPDAVGRTFLVKDDPDISTAELIRRMAAGLHRPARLLSVPPLLLSPWATLVGKREEAKRVLGSLVVDDSLTRRVLNWTPPLTLDEGIARMVGGA